MYLPTPLCYRGRMISYDDLVARLQSWRVRNGLSVTTATTAESAGTAAAQDDISAEQLEVIDDDHHRSHDFTLDSIGSDEATPIGGVPDPPRRF